VKHRGVDIRSSGWAPLDPHQPGGGKPIAGRTEPKGWAAPDPNRAKAVPVPVPLPEPASSLYPTSAQPRRRAWGKWYEAAE
jgi:hypothetical protein